MQRVLEFVISFYLNFQHSAGFGLSRWNLENYFGLLVCKEDIRGDDNFLIWILDFESCHLTGVY